MKNRNPKELDSQFIDDLDPYAGKNLIPSPDSTESNTDEAWQDFQDSVLLFQSDTPPAKPR